MGTASRPATIPEVTYESPYGNVSSWSIRNGSARRHMHQYGTTLRSN